MLIDSHCHLDYFVEDEIAAVVERAHAAGVERIVTIGVRLAQAERVKALLQRFPGVWGTVGVHPHHVGEEAVATPEAIAALADHPRIIGIGESGLDYFYDKAPRPLQQESFRQHIRAARLAGLPLVIHARHADEDVLAILREEREGGGAFDFVLHCFSSGRTLAMEAVRLGGYVSFSGILTFPKATALQSLARELPGERLLIETDAPYLAPVPFRGRRCEPAMVVETAKFLGALRGSGLAAIAALTTANFYRLFRKAG